MKALLLGAIGAFVVGATFIGGYEVGTNRHATRHAKKNADPYGFGTSRSDPYGYRRP